MSTSTARKLRKKSSLDVLEEEILRDTEFIISSRVMGLKTINVHWGTTDLDFMFWIPHSSFSIFVHFFTIKGFMICDHFRWVKQNLVKLNEVRSLLSW